MLLIYNLHTAHAFKRIRCPLLPVLPRVPRVRLQDLKWAQSVAPENSSLLVNFCFPRSRDDPQSTFDLTTSMSDVIIIYTGYIKKILNPIHVNFHCGLVFPQRISEASQQPEMFSEAIGLRVTTKALKRRKTLISPRMINVFQHFEKK